LEEKDCDDCNFTAGVSMTESVCNFLGEESKEKCEDIVKSFKLGEKSFIDTLNEIEPFLSQLSKEKAKTEVKGQNQLYMFVEKDCPRCDLAKELLEKPIENKNMMLIPFGTKEGLEKARILGIDSIPSIVYRNDDTNTIEKCVLTEDGSKIHCESKIFDTKDL
jgi:hypothetical protein